MKNKLILFALFAFIFSACKKKETPDFLVLSFTFSDTLTRLDNFGNPSIMPAGNAGQNPRFNKLGVHYIELAENQYTQLGKGQVIYQTPDVTTGGDKAIEFSSEKMVTISDNKIYIPLNILSSGTYQYIRISLGYQNYEIDAYADLSAHGLSNQELFKTTLASFVGYNSYITAHKIKDSTITINANKKQGFGALELYTTNAVLSQMQKVFTFDAPTTTVVNPISATSPIPAGSCVVTSAFKNGPLQLNTGQGSNINVDVAISVNKSFEWKDVNGNGRFDIYPPVDTVVDMGVRGMVAIVK